MERIEKTVFISYRRTNASWALAIFQNLTNHGYDVFLDYEGIPSGDFEGVILENINSRAHFLVLLTPSALERCGEPGDWLRREIETALASKRNIIPLMLEGFSFGTPTISTQLTGTLATLKKYNALEIPPSFFVQAMERLRTRFLNVPLTAVLQPASTLAQQAATGQKSAAQAAPPVQEQELTAQQYFERGVASSDPDDKIRLYTEAIRLNPCYAEAFNSRALAYRAKGDLDVALIDLNEAIRLKPDLAAALYNRGVVLQDKGDLEGALADFNQAIRLKPDDGGAFNNRGNLRLKKGDLEGALADFNQAIRLEPDDGAAFNNRGTLRLKKGDLDGALADSNQAIRLEPGNAVGFNNRGRVREDKGDLDGALADYNEAIRLKPDNALAFENRGHVRRAKGNLDGALADFLQYLWLRQGTRDGNTKGVEWIIRYLRVRLTISRLWN
jgi:tetratricopeptide (TPR) repeat protein